MSEKSSNGKFNVQPGEAVGVIGAQSIGEPGTQFVLRVFHSAGVLSSVSTKGLPRLIELIDARKKPKTPSMTIYLDKSVSKSLDETKQILKKIEKVRVSDVVSTFSEDLEAKELVLSLDKEKMQLYQVTEKAIFNKLAKFQNILVSELADMRIKIKLKKLKVQKSASGRKKTKDGENEEQKKMSIKATRVAFVDLLNSIIFGVPNINKAVIKESESGELYIATSGSNLAEVINIEGVDKEKCYTNDPFEALAVYGIEAARNTIANEIKSVLDDENIMVSFRHIGLLVDTMTFYGVIKSVGRKGIAGKKESVLARAAYEETVKHFTNAAVFGEKDMLKGVAENILIGKQVQVGTGRIKLMIKNSDLKKLKSKEDKA
ncbi:DNA-directed RNA polymerase subunit A'' [Candidatus Marsarchaeota archaeon]|nr:DNA-directed RNA polymerase subunit A'' [Candidatus Marsarchaeota archaeon]